MFVVISCKSAPNPVYIRTKKGFLLKFSFVTLLMMKLGRLIDARHDKREVLLKIPAMKSNVKCLICMRHVRFDLMLNQKSRRGKGERDI